MNYGICNLSIIPVRAEASDASEMVTQLLFGELYKVTETRKKWVKIRCTFDGYEGWIDRKQALSIEKETYYYLKSQTPAYSADPLQLIDFQVESQHLFVPQGSSFYGYQEGTFSWLENTIPFAGHVYDKQISKADFVDIALSYLNAPYLWGGRTPFGIDCSGFSQMIYKIGGKKIPRDASQQALLGEPLSFIEEAEPGDLAFFDNAEGLITHVGILLANNYIIHASGKVRVDRLDQHGIFNAEERAHTHKLRVIKQIF